MCCRGCQAVAQAIVDGGLEDFYRHRSVVSPTARELVPAELQQMELYNRPEVQQGFVKIDDEHVREAALILEGILCAACVWLNEQHVSALPGVIEFRVNYATRRAHVKWDNSRLHLSDILKAISDIGYVAHPYNAGTQEDVFKRERAQALRRIAVAGIGMMQVMTFAVALYAGAYQDMDLQTRNFFRWVSMLIAVPVVFYAARPFFTAALRDLQRFHAGMDVPVALAIGSAFIASVWATLTGGGEVYFDSVSMFTFFLLTSRFLEMGARQRAGQAAEELMRLLPAVALRIENGDERLVAVTDLSPGDHVLIRPGDLLPADGHVVSGHSSVDESLLTGESLPLSKSTGDRLTGGTLNIDSPLTMQVDATGEDTVHAAIVRLLDRAQTQKPPIAALADRLAGWFVLALLMIAVITGGWWWQARPEDAFWVVLSVLVVTCPCALSLATPAAITAATGTLTRAGLLTTRSHALETLARITDVVFDKTGTLTQGRLQVQGITLLRDNVSEQQCRAIAAALETGSAHPVAKALQHYTDERPAVTELRAQSGRGVEGVIETHRWRIGTHEYVSELSGSRTEEAYKDMQAGGTPVYLADAHGMAAMFILADQIRAESAHTVRHFRRAGIQVHLISGDSPAAVNEVAAQTGIEQAGARMLPQAKLDYLQALQSKGKVVAMVGDGVNDAPVLAAAQVSIAMGGGTQLAQASADMVLLSEQLSHLVEGLTMSRRTLRIIRQNLGWALGYNLVALPLAVMGLVAPWMAALGMSTSSLIVVVNSLRLRRLPD